MNPKRALFIAPLLMGLFTGCASLDRAGGGGTVEVVYDNPDNFTDMTRRDLPQGADQGYLRELERHIERVGQNQISEGQMLTVTIHDVDMAGDFEPQRGPDFNDIRIVKEIYPPRIDLSFRLTDSSGAVIAEGDRQLRDNAFNWRISPVDREDPLRHEKALVDNFLRDLPNN